MQGSFVAENAHQALSIQFNPAESMFGNPSLLESDSIKQLLLLAEAEDTKLAEMPTIPVAIPVAPCIGADVWNDDYVPRWILPNPSMPSCSDSGPLTRASKSSSRRKTSTTRQKQVRSPLGEFRVARSGRSKAGLRGLWESALRINELMSVSWDKPGTIRPRWKDGTLPVLAIPAAMQKNNTDDEIPLLPGFAALLLETPVENRTGWVFDPKSLQTRFGRRVRHQRPDSDWVGKVISRIGKAANIVVEAAVEKSGRRVKYASAHDLRRSCCEQMLEAGVPPLIICRVMRHSS